MAVRTLAGPSWVVVHMAAVAREVPHIPRSVAAVVAWVVVRIGAVAAAWAVVRMGAVAAAWVVVHTVAAVAWEAVRIPGLVADPWAVVVDPCRAGRRILQSFLAGC